MGYHIVIGDRAAGDFASTGGMADFGHWVDTLDAGLYPNLVHLREYGWSSNLDALKKEIGDALKTSAPAVTGVASTASGLLEKLGTRLTGEKVVVISDGA